MTVLSVAQDVLAEIGEFEIPGSFVGNSSATAKQVLAIANRVGNEVAREKEDWSWLLTSYTFTTTNGTANYDLPSDYRYIVNATWWDRTNYWQIFGPATPEQWQTLKSGIVTNGVRRWFRIQDGDFYLHPTPTTTGDTIAYEYLSNAWAVATDGTTKKTSFTADTDSPLFDEFILHLGLKAHYLKEKGLPYADDWNDYINAVERAKGRDGGAPKLRLDSTSQWYRDLGMVNIPEAGFGA
jgi:hypothetical protein